MGHSSLYILFFFLFFSLSCEKLSTQDRNKIPKEFYLNESKDHSLLPIGTISKQEEEKLYSAFILEIYRDIFLKNLKDKKKYMEWMNVLKQGASVEGVYRGIILSKEYRQMEVKASSKESLRKFFSFEMASLDSKWINKKIIPPKELVEKANLIQKKLDNVSFFTLKRVLGEEFLVKLSSLRKEREKLAYCYASLSSRWAKLGVDFALKERNRADFDFHFSWAMKNSLGRIQWEVLNRLHRIMNYYEYN